jgi:DNA helicase MCM8
MASALLSRFDLIFILLDRADEQNDRRISEHIMGITAAASEYESFSDGADRKSATASSVVFDRVETLSQRLRRQCSQLRGDYSLRPVPAAFMRKYIEYARSEVHPVLSPAAAKVLQLMYLTMRAQGIEGLGDSNSSYNSSGAIPVTTRHLESLIRLAQARARMELRTEVMNQLECDSI